MATKSKNSRSATNKTNVKLGWHFLPADRKLSEGDGRTVSLGQTLTMKYNSTETPACCSYGMHASERISQAAKFEKGPVLCRVEVWGNIDTNHDKFCGRHRRVIWWKELTKAEMAQLAGGSAKGYSASNSEDNLLRGMRYGMDFDKNAEALAKKHGWDDAKNAVNPVGDTPRFVQIKEKLSDDTVVSLLDKRFVRTRAEIEKQLGNVFDMSESDDVFDDLEYDSRVHVIEDFTKDGARGYLRTAR